MKFQAKGIIPAMVTPLTQDYKVNEPALRKMIDYFIKGGVHGLFVVGTSGEFYGFSPEERRSIFEITVDEAKGRIPVYAGANGITTREAVELTQLAEDCKVDAVSVLTPMFISVTQQELYDHYVSIARSTSLPMLMYNNVTKTNVNISADTVARLSEIENIVGVKDSSGDFTLTGEYIRKTRGKEFSVLCGRDTLIHACLCYGGHGAITACANIAPRLMADIYDKYVAGDVAGSLEAQFLSAPIRMAFNLGSFPTVLKESLQLLGIDAGPSFAPVGTMSTENKELLKKALKEGGVLA
ncbi:MAG TPA: 4-hydroxy-tetrahydrodipicolinate synthase [Sphaerochaeta sp.]|nr:MAG: 4-hydroxy-tetrahydrodipicolinate synthase [Spirochaetes bacterium GWC2_52_13]HCG63023.1 4-hydroxy-tetrahydrodipicolinate synthase [Sphaerochaeta sp.]HCS35445.1 4-hydroxy-tetrahydrodipicolinate synthase [Sphaerochaeta sp.]